VVDWTADVRGGWALELEGEAGRTYDVRLIGVEPVVAGADGASAEILPGETEGGGSHRVRVRFPEGHGRRLATVHLDAKLNTSLPGGSRP